MVSIFIQQRKHMLNQKNYRVVDEHYSMIPKSDIPRSTFRQIHEHKTTGPAGYLIPILVQEVLPGDVHNCSVTVFARISTLLFPLMDNAEFKTEFFFVPARILWDNWKKFMGEQTNPGDSISYIIPTINPFWPATTTAFSSFDLSLMLADYMGIPLANGSAAPGSGFYVNALPFRAINLIWNEWYRDQNLQNALIVHKGDTGDIPGDYNLLKRNKRHDYFTSCLPAPQKGAAVTMPLGTQAPVKGIGLTDQHWTSSPVPSVIGYYETGGGAPIYPYHSIPGQDLAPPSAPGIKQGWAIRQDASGVPMIYADLSQATAATINSLRLAVQTQKLLERDMRGGTRYTESLKSHWGVNAQDGRLQRPEYIGGGTTFIQTAAIAQTAPTGGTVPTPFGGLAGQATVAGQHHYTCIGHEHGYIIGLGSLMTRPTYQEGIDKLYQRRTRYDFPWPEFAALGEQTVTNEEIYAQGTITDGGVFGYQERYAEMRFQKNRVSALFRTKNTSSITQWHLAQSFLNLPTLGPTFIQEDAPWDRVLAGQTPDFKAQQFIADIQFINRLTRALPAYGVPGSLQGTF